MRASTSVIPLPSRLRACIAAIVGVLVTACATGMAVQEAPTAADIPALHERLTRNPGDVAVRLRLADAYRRNNQVPAAIELLEPIARTEPAATLYLGMAYEDAGRFTDARRLYEQFLAYARSPELRDRVSDRLALLHRLELQQAVRAALANERTVSTRAPEPRTIGVVPFLVSSADPELRPLGTALAELLTTDLSQTDRLRVLERAQLRHLLDEIQLAESGRVDPQTGSRSGRILGAGSIVQGRIEGGQNEITVQTAVLRLPNDTTARNPLRERAALNNIFDIEKRTALAIYERLGIQLTAAELQRIRRMPTTNVQALIALGYGLEAQDAGRYEEAAGHFARALQLDPNFTLARSHRDETTVLQRSAAAGLDVIGRLGAADIGPIIATQRMQRTLEAVEFLVPNPAARDAAAEALGSEGTTRSGTAEIVIRRPGGGS
jgi:tetratricopeptide (TPR) repeat protein